MKFQNHKVIFHDFVVCHLLTFFKNQLLQKKNISECQTDWFQIMHFVGPDLGPICHQGKNF